MKFKFGINFYVRLWRLWYNFIEVVEVLWIISSDCLSILLKFDV